MHKNTSIVWLIVVIVLQACAVVRAPDGGPEDKEGPTVVMADSVHLRTNIRQRDFTLIFSERVDRVRAQECISISPERALSFSWSARSCTIHVDDSLERLDFRAAAEAVLELAIAANGYLNDQADEQELTGSNNS